MTEVKRVYAFGRDASGVNKTEGNKSMKFVLGGKGANLAEMANMGLPVPPGFTITCQACMEYYNSEPPGFPEGLEEEIAANVARPRGQDGQAPGRCRRSAARVGSLGIALLDARHDGHGAEPRPQRHLRSGAHQHRPGTSASHGTATAASSRCSRRSFSMSKATLSRTRSFSSDASAASTSTRI